MIDSHCHFDFPVFDQDREAILDRCNMAGVTKILIPGVAPRYFVRQVALAEQHQNINIALGIHPHFLPDDMEEALQQLSASLSRYKDKVVAVGEIGLDYVFETDAAVQRDYFIRQLWLANEFALPVIVHHRKSHNDLIRLLKQHPVPRGGVIHAFSGSQQEADTYIDMGFKLGIGGTITYPRAKKTRETVASVPLASLLLETDAPDMPLNGRQGTRNSPEFLPEVVQHLADLQNCSVEQVKEVTTSNFAEVFARH